MLDRNIAAEVLSRAVSTGGDFAEIFLEDTLSHTVSLRSRRIESANTGRIHGAGIRVLQGTSSVYVYTNDTGREGLMRCAEQAAAAVKAGAGCSPIAMRPVDYARPQDIRVMPDTVRAALKAEKLRAADAAARALSSEIVQVTGTCTDSIQRVLICNTEGVWATDERVRVRLGVSAVASDGHENQTGFEGPGGTVGFEAFESIIDPEKAARTAASSAITMLHAPVCPAGVMPVVIDNGFGGVIFHEACGHSLEATSVAWGLSEFSGKLGQMIASPIVTAIDDGTIPGRWGSLHVDDEGMAPTNLTLIKDGKLVNYMIDKLGGRRMNMAPTGSSRRQSYKFAPTSRMRNTYIAAGHDSEEEMIATMGDGLYAKKMGGGSVNPATGEFNFAVSEGYLVKDGRIVHPVRGASLIGKGGEVLQRIDRVGSKLALADGMCGSVSGSVPTCVGQPMIRVSSLTVGGR